MRSPRLPYYYYLPPAVISLLFTLSVSFTLWYGVGSWDMNRTVNWGFGWFGMDYMRAMYLKILLTSLPTFAVVINFMRKFIQRKELHLLKAIMLAILGFLMGLVCSVLLSS